MVTGKIDLGREPLSCHVRVPGAQNKGSQLKDEILWGWLVVQWYFFPHEIFGIGVVPKNVFSPQVNLPKDSSLVCVQHHIFDQKENGV